ncbi:MAG: acyloxyacyl hydrolase, partial [Alphaproteobacteria bacterium]|nr:acyloxyacyl hydrolase [Alphaproteobacteria bacterium]
ELTFPFPQGDPRNDPISEETVFFGSRDLFRTSLALNGDLGDKWGAQVMYEHLSHGQILGSGRNQGIDNVGVRVIYRLGE